ncbi:MAG: twin-arginine translocase subunit TatB [Alphaproteobacteria bacterium]|nr:twin-arginine translocase subunit TatB [Alphaproteobacteria bacterium]
MFDFAWSEMALIAVVALVVLGPKELPYLLRTAGQWVAKARELARDFQGQVDEMVREAELADVKKEVETVGQQIEEVARTDIAGEIEKTVDPKGEMSEHLKLPELAQVEQIAPPATTEAPPQEAITEPAADAAADPALAEPAPPAKTATA